MNWPPAKHIRRIAVVRVSSLGDVVLCEPVVRAVADRYPDAMLTFVTRAAYHAVFDGHPQVGGVATLDVARAADFDLVVDLHGRWETRRWALGARHRVTWQKRDFVDLVGAAFRRPIRARAGEADAQTMRMLADLGLPAAAGGLAARIRPTDSAPCGRRGVLLPGGPWATKRWPLPRWLELAQRLGALGRTCVALGGPGDEAVLDALRAAGVDALPADLELRSAAAHLAGAPWVVGHDSGLTHVAAALGRPTVVLFGPTRVSRWAPRGPHVRVVSMELPCSPCSDYGQRACPLGARRCLDELPAVSVVEALLALTSVSGSPELIAERAE